MITVGKVTIRVVQDDALSFECDILALKFAQKLYGLDASAVAILQDRYPDIESELPPPAGFRFYDSPHETGPKGFLFVGVPSLRNFLYDEMQEFGARVLSSLAGSQPSVKVLAVTLHGVGYGLDEHACLEAQLSGILRSLESGDAPVKLQEIVFVEQNRGRANRLARHLASLSDRAGDEPDQARRLAEIALNYPQHPTVFVAMPFADEFEDVYNFGIQRVLHDRGFKAERMDQESFVGDVLSEIKRRIQRAVLVVADLTGGNPNVYLEVGFAWGTRIPTILLVRKSPSGVALRFDTQGQRVLIYDNITDLNRKLDHEINELTSQLHVRAHRVADRSA